MELRKDPITRSWVAIRHGEPELIPAESCPYCVDPNRTAPPALLALPERASPPQVRVLAHPDPLFGVEGETARAAEGFYDKMRAVGAHEVVVEFAEHHRRLSAASDAEIALVLEGCARRISELKRDDRFKYVSVYKNVGAAAGQEVGHSYSEVVATPFVPRRVLHELRSARDYFHLKDRCLFCDLLRQELDQKTRLIEATGRYAAFCPFATRSPYEIWLLPRRHDFSFKAGVADAQAAAELAQVLRRTLQRLEQVAEGYHLVLHTAPNSSGILNREGFWESLEEDYHWHLELMPVLARRSQPQIAKEVYISPVAPEKAAAHLRELPVTD